MPRCGIPRPAGSSSRDAGLGRRPSTPPPGPTRSRRAARPGQALVEFALIVPVFLFLLVIAIDFGRLFFSYIEIHNAAREGAAFGAVAPTDCGGTPCSSSSGIATHARQETNAQAQRGESALVVTATCADAGGASIACSAASGGAGAGSTITVSVAERFTFLTPLIGNVFGGGLQMGSSATAAVLGYASSGSGSPPGSCSAPSADFSVTVTSGRTIFADPSASRPNSGVCNISGYNWTWGDGNTDVGTASGSSHTYGASGTYNVVLEVTNQGGSTTKTLSVTVPVGAPPPTCTKPTANFNWTRSGKTYTYRDGSSVADPTNCPITDWLWTFTDTGTQSNAQNPAPVTYGNNSSHPVTLTVTNAAGSTTITLNT